MCIYKHVNVLTPEQLAALAIHVDDMKFVFPRGTDYLKQFIQGVSSRFEVTDLGPVCFMLGIEFIRNREARTIMLTQRGYINTVLERFKMACPGTKGRDTPLQFGVGLTRKDCPAVDDLKLREEM